MRARNLLSCFDYYICFQMRLTCLLIAHFFHAHVFCIYAFRAKEICVFARIIEFDMDYYPQLAAC